MFISQELIKLWIKEEEKIAYNQIVEIISVNLRLYLFSLNSVYCEDRHCYPKIR